jgi:hypothetical protein
MAVLLNVDAFSNGRTIAEKIENKSFKNANALLRHIKEEESDADVYENVQMYSLSDFAMELNENSCFTENYWLTFVALED